MKTTMMKSSIKIFMADIWLCRIANNYFFYGSDFRLPLPIFFLPTLLPKQKKGFPLKSNRFDDSNKNIKLESSRAANFRNQQMRLIK